VIERYLFKKAPVARYRVGWLVRFIFCPAQCPYTDLKHVPVGWIFYVSGLDVSRLDCVLALCICAFVLFDQSCFLYKLIISEGSPSVVGPIVYISKSCLG